MNKGGRGGGGGGGRGGGKGGEGKQFLQRRGGAWRNEKKWSNEAKRGEGDAEIVNGLTKAGEIYKHSCLIYLVTKKKYLFPLLLSPLLLSQPCPTPHP